MTIALVELFLTQQGYKVTATDRGETALSLVQKTPDAFDVVVSDIDMPGMTGDKLAQELRQLRPDLPIKKSTRI